MVINYGEGGGGGASKREVGGMGQLKFYPYTKWGGGGGGGREMFKPC